MKKRLDLMESEMKRKKTITENLIIYALKTFVLSVSPFVIFPYVSRILGADGVGEVQYAFSIASYFQLLAGLGISSYGIREGAGIKDDREKLGSFSSELLLINLVSSTCSLLLYFFVIGIYGGLEQYRPYLYLFGFYVFCAGFTLDWFASIKEDFLYVTITTCVFQAVVLLMAFFFIREKSDTIIYGAVLCLPHIFASIANALYIHKSVPLKKKGLHLKKHIGSILFLFAIIVSANVYSLLDTTMLGIMKSDEAVGLYTAASKYTRLVVQLVLSLCTVFLPRFVFYLSTRQIERFEKLFVKSFQVIMWMVTPFCIGMFVLSPELILIFSGEGFLESISTMRILSVNIIFSAIDGFLGWQILVPLKKEKLLMLATFTGAILDIVLNILWIPIYSINGAAFATLCSELSVFIICFFSCRRHVPLVKVMRTWWKYICAALPIFAIRYMIRLLGITNIFVIVFLEIVLSAITYTGILCVLKEPMTLETGTKFIDTLLRR